MLRAEALAALAHASSFDELWSWLRQRAQGLNYHSAAAAQGATTSRAHCDDGSAWNAADGTAAATLPQEAGAECPQAPQLQHQQPPLPPVEQLGWGPDLALAFVGRLQELGAVLHAPARRTLLREATSQWLAAGVPEQQPAAAGAEAAEAGGPAATGEGAAAGAGAGAAERRHAACLATGGDVLCVTPSPEAAQRLLAAVRSLGDPEQPGSQLVLALAAPHFGRLHRAITNVDGSSGGPSKSVEVGAGGGGGPGASSAGLPPARWPPSSAAAAALVSLGAEMVRAGFPVSFTQAAVAAKSAAVTPGSVEAPVFQAVWEVVGRCVTMPGPDPSLPPLPALVAARAALRVELGLARAAEVLRRGGDAVKGVPGAAAAGAAADGAVRDEPGAARVLQQLLMNTRDTARTGRALSADQLLECAQRVEAAEAAAEVAGGVGEAAVITRAGSRRPAETAAANIRGGTRGFVTQLVLAHAAALDTLTAPPERLLALAHACLLLEKRGARAVDDLMVMRHEGQRLQGALGRTLMRRLQKGSGVLATPPPPPQQLAPSHRHGRSRPPPAKREVEERQQQEERQQAEVRRVERVLRQQLMQLLLHPRNTRPPLELRQAVTDLLLRGGVGGGAGVGGAAGGAAGGGLWDHVRPTVFDVVLRRLMATPIYWRWQPPQPPQPSYAAAAADTLVPGAAAANAAQGCHGPGWPGVGQEHLDYYVHPVETGVLVGEAGTEAEALSLARAELAAAEEEVGMVAAAEAVGARARARGAASSGLGRSLPHGGASAAELPVGLSAVAMHMAKVVAEAEEDVRWASRRPAPAASGQADDPTDDAAAHLPEEGATSRVPAATAFGLFHLAADLLRRGAPPAGVAAEADAMGTAEEEAPSQASSEPLGEAGAVHKPAFASRTATGASTAATLPAAAAVLLSNSSRLLARLLRQGPGAGASAGADDRSSDTPWGRGDAAGLALSHALAEQYGRLGQLAAADAAVLGLIVQGAERGAAEALRDAHALRVSATATAQMGSGRQDSGSAGALERARAAALEARLRQRLRQLATVSEVLAERWYEPAADCRLTQQLEDLVTALCAPTHERRLGAAGPAQLMPTGALPVVATPGTSGHQAPQAAPSAAPAPAPAPAAPAAATTAVASVDHDTFRLLCATAWLASLPRAGERLRREERREQAEAEAQQQFLEEEAAADAGASSGGFDSGSSGGISSPADQRVAVPVVAEGEALASDEADARALRLVRLVEGQVAAAASSSSSNAAAAAAAAAAATSTPASAGMGAASAQGAGLLSLRTAYALTEAFMNVGVMPPVVRRLLSEEVPLAARGPLSRGGGAGAGAPALQAGAELPGVVGGRSRVIARVYRQVFAARVLGGGAAGAAGASGAAGAVGDGAIAGGGDAHDLPHSRRVRLAVRLLHEGIIGPRDALAALRGDLEHVLPRLRDPRRLAALVGMVAAAPAAPPSREALLQLSVRQPRPRLESAGAASQAALGLPDADAFGPVPTPVVSGGEAALDAEAEGQQNERARAEARASQDRAGVLFKPLALMAKDRAVPLEHLRIICATLHACPVVLPPYVMAALTERLKWEIPLPKPLPQRQQQWQQQPPPGHGPATGVVSASLEPVAAQGSPDSGAAAGPGAADDLDMLAETSSLGVTGAAAAGHPSFSALAQAASDADRHAHLDQLVVFWLRQLQQSGKLGYQVEANAAGHRATPPCGAAAGAEAELPLGIGSSSSRSSSRSSFAAVCGYASDVIAASSQRTAGESELQEGGLLVRVAARAVDSLLMQGCQGGGRSAGFSRSDANGHDSVGGPGQNAESSEGVPGLTPPPLGAADDGTGGAEAAAEALRLVCLIAPTSGSLGAAQQSEIVNRVLAVLPARQASLHDSSDAGHVSPERGSQLDLAAQQAPQLRAPFLSASDAVDVLEQVSQARAAIWAPVVERVLQLLTSGGHQGRDRMAELVQQHMTQTSARRHQSHMDKLLRLTSEGMPVPGASLHGPWGASEGPEHLPAAYAVWRREVPAVLASVLQAAASSCPSLPSQKGEPVVAGGPLPQAQVQLLLDSLGQAVRLARSWLLQSVGAGGADVAAGAGAGTLAPQTQPLLLPLPAAATPRLTEAVAAALRALDAHAARMSLASLRRYLSDRDALQTWLEHQRRQQQLQEAAANGVAGEDAGACGQRQAYGVGVETQAASHRPAAAAAVNAAAAAVPQRDPLAALRRQSGLLQLAELLPELRGLATVFQALAAPPPTEAAKGDEEPGLPSGSQAEPQNVTLIQPDQVDAFSGAWPCLQEQLRLVEAALRAVYDSRRELAPADELMTAVGGAVAELPTELMQVLVQALQSADEACAAFNVARKALNWRLQEHKEAMREQLKRREDANAASAEVLRANAAAEQLSSQIMHSHIAVTAARDLVRAWQRESMLPLAEELAATLQAHAAQLLPAANAQSSTASPDAALEGATGSAAAAGAAASTADMLVSVLGSNNLAPPTAAPSSAECNLSPLRQFHMALGASAALAARGWWHDSLAAAALLAAGPAFCAVATANTGVTGGGGQGGAVAAAVYEVALPALRLHAAGCGRGAGAGDRQRELALVLLLQAMEDWGPAVLRAAKAPSAAATAPGAAVAASVPAALPAGHAQRQQGTQGPPPQQPSPVPPQPLAVELLLALVGVGYVRGQLPYALASDVLWQLEAARDDAEWGGASERGRTTGASGGAGGSSVGLHHSHLEALLTAAPALAHIGSGAGGAGRVDMGDLAAGGNLDPIAGGRRAVGDLLVELCRALCDSGMLEAAAAAPDSHGNSGAGVSVDAMCALAHALSQASAPPQPFLPRGLTTGAVTSITTGSSTRLAPSQHESKLYNRMYVLLLQGAVGPGPSPNSAAGPSNPNNAPQSEVQGGCGGAADLPAAVVRLARLAACGRNRGDVLMAAEAAAQLGGVLRRLAAEGDARTCAAVLEALDGLMREGHGWMGLVLSPPPPQLPRSTTARAAAASLAPASAHSASQQLQLYPLRHGPAQDIAALLADWPADEPTTGAASAILPDAAAARARQGSGNVRRRDEGGAFGAVRSTATPPKTEAVAALRPAAAATATVGPFVVAQLLWRSVDVLPTDIAVSVLGWAAGGRSEVTKQQAGAALRVGPGGDGDTGGLGSSAHSAHHTTAREQLVRVWQRLAGRILLDQAAGADAGSCRDRGREGDADGLLLDASGAASVLAAGEALGCVDVAMTQALADVVAQELEGDH